MKTAIALLLTFAATIVSINFALAETTETYAYVTKVTVGEDEHLSINVRGNFRPVHRCTRLTYARSQYTVKDERTKAMMRIAIVSFLARKKVTVTTNKCYPGTCTTIVDPRTGLCRSIPEGTPIMTDIQVMQD